MTTNDLAARAAVLPCVRALSDNLLGVHLDGTLIKLAPDALTPEIVETLEQLQDLQDTLHQLLTQED